MSERERDRRDLAIAGMSYGARLLIAGSLGWAVATGTWWLATTAALSTAVGFVRVVVFDDHEI